MCKKKKIINIELWFEISLEWNHFLVRLKPLLHILFVTFLTTSPTFPEAHIFDILLKILKNNGVVLVSLLLTLNIFNTLF